MIRILALLVFVPASCLVAAPAKKKGEAEVRFLAERIPNQLGQVVLANKEARSTPFKLPMNNLSPPIKSPGRLFSVSLVDQNASIATVKLPEEGNSFIVLLFLNQQSGYKPLVIPFHNDKFRAGDVYFFNNTTNLRRCLSESLQGRCGGGLLARAFEPPRS